MGPGGAGRRRRRPLAVLAGIAVMSLVLLTRSAPAPPWAERAVEWVQARDRAAHRSVADLLQFESPHTVHVLCCNQGAPIEGREAVGDFMRTSFGDTVEEGTMGRAYVDVSGVVVEYRFPGAADERPPGGGEPADRNEVQVSEVDRDGSMSRTLHAVSLRFLAAPVYDGRGWYGDDLGAARLLVERYLAAWSGRDGAAVGALYAENATVLDSLLGTRLTGRSSVASYDAAHGGTPLRWNSLPQVGGPALYGYWSGYRSHLAAYVSFTGDDGNGCPGAVTAQLQIQGGRIVSERRYHDVADMRRCVAPEQLPDGWWTHAAVPAPIQDQVTGTVTAAGREVEVHNGNAAAEDLVRWAMARFPAAGLTAPKVAFVAFRREAHLEQCTPGTWGQALQPDTSSRVYLCLTVDGGATSFQREVMLHELAHAWMWQNLDEERQRQFVAHLCLPGWDGAGIPWDQRGIEQAADVLVWGLTKDLLPSQELDDRSSAELTDAFRVLTGTAPLRSQSCPVPSSRSALLRVALPGRAA